MKLFSYDFTLPFVLWYIFYTVYDTILLWTRGKPRFDSKDIIVGAGSRNIVITNTKQHVAMICTRRDARECMYHTVYELADHPTKTKNKPGGLVTFWRYQNDGSLHKIDMPRQMKQRLTHIVVGHNIVDKAKHRGFPGDDVITSMSMTRYVIDAPKYLGRVGVQCATTGDILILLPKGRNSGHGSFGVDARYTALVLEGGLVLYMPGDDGPILIADIASISQFWKDRSLEVHIYRPVDKYIPSVEGYLPEKEDQFGNFIILGDVSHLNVNNRPSRNF